MSGLMREIMRNPTVKDILRGHLKGISTDGGRTLVRDLVWQDFEVFLGVLGSVPAVINACAGGLAQLMSEFNTKFTPRLLKEFMGSILKDIDVSELKDLGNAAAGLAGSILAASPELKDIIAEKGPALIARGINAGTAGINELCSRDPALIGDFLARVIDNLDKPALSDAALNLADAVLDQKLGLVSWTGRLVARRIAKRLRRFRPAS